MKITCGTDIIEIERIKQTMEDMEDAFKERVFTESEIKYCESRKKQKYQHYAARFAAKEAVFKAISPNLSDKYAITWKDIEIIDDKEGKPYVHLYGLDESIFESIDISISHCREYAVAYVVALQRS